MSRPARIEYPDAYYHVMNRGRSHQDIFHGDEYFETFLSVLSDTVARFGLEIHAYCLMSNHYHLLVSTPEGDLQRAMRHIGSVYTQRYNRLRQADGSLFKGRYIAILIDRDEYLLHVSKYIHLNPLEARMIEHLSDYRWSSYPAYINKCRPQTWLSVNEVYDQLTNKRNKANRYKAYVEEIEMSNDVRSFYSKQRTQPILGDKEFKESLQQEDSTMNIETPRYARLISKPSFDEVVDVVALYYGVNREQILEVKRGRGLKNVPRKMAMYVCQYCGGYKLTEIANNFGLTHYGGVGSAINVIKKQMKSEKKTQRDFNSIIKRFDP